ncbi:hypothetical protein BB560_002911 [Smittium megazygosporum]|uniref:Uncharacterized protein n=1 Tax=Smittium megazygosporum TaxID=133381 RepID=A0A2T9ZDF3_9FUNG|nr:hypothetical protein BB560_002911 [Smittium megazygosporum]
MEKATLRDSGISKKKLAKKAPNRPTLSNPYFFGFPSLSTSARESILDNVSREKRLKIHGIKKKPITRDSQLRGCDKSEDTKDHKTMDIQKANIQPSYQWVNDIIFGINSITIFLEKQISIFNTHIMENPEISNKEKYTNENDSTICDESGTVLIFCCALDVLPQHVFGHLPMLVYILNQRKMNFYKSIGKPYKKVKLVTLPQNSEKMISDLFGVKRVCAFALFPNSPYFSELEKLVFQTVGDVNMLNNFEASSVVRPTDSLSKNKHCSLDTPLSTDSPSFNPLNVRFISKKSSSNK